MYSQFLNTILRLNSLQYLYYCYCIFT